ncbi:hypothetical protein GCM10008938_36470 [Deinococcus roseus]|uniref:Uncharacterized protein n=1 Tax=Deinococcus roseus TaxID=392414 RepID=A0ABQ2D5M7_9DEIO|nr:hypothetical protein GCM10008938_36470 [Deinococcus roseus]
MWVLHAYTTAMSELQVVQGYISVYEVLGQVGELYPGKTWKKLLRDHTATLPDHTLKQFMMSDGRKGRLVPAIRLQDYARLVRHLDHLDPVQTSHDFLPGREKELLRFLSKAFRDLEPVLAFQHSEVVLDLYFVRSQVGVLLHSPRRARLSQYVLQGLQRELGCVVLPVHPYQEGFDLGEVLWELRRLIQQQELQSL